MIGREMLDRIAAFMREQGDAADSETIARQFLRLSSAGTAAAAALVRAVLSADARFEETAQGTWRLSTERGVGLAPPALLAAIWIPTAGERTPWLWRTLARPWQADGRPLCHCGLERSADLEQMLDIMSRYPVVTEQASALGRWIGVQERLHASPEIDPLIIDARAWRALLSREEPQPGPATGMHAHHAGGAPSRSSDVGADEIAEWAGERLAALHGQLEEILAAAGARALRSWVEVAAFPHAARGSAREELWQEPRAFGPAELEAVPEEPGTYRFFDADGRLLYVGKSGNLRRRIAAHFRPFGPHPGQWAAHLRQIYRFETVPTGSELEALIREAQEIAGRKPAWNVQVRVEPGSATIPLSDRDLVLILPDATQTNTLFLLSGERTTLLRIPGNPDPAALAGTLREFYSADTPAAGQSDHGLAVEEIPHPERSLVRRWLSWDRHGGSTLRLADFATYTEAALALCQALGQSPEGDVEQLPTIVRGEGKARTPRRSASGPGPSGARTRAASAGRGPRRRARPRA